MQHRGGESVWIPPLPTCLRGGLKRDTKSSVYGVSSRAKIVSLFMIMSKISLLLLPPAPPTPPFCAPAVVPHAFNSFSVLIMYVYTAATTN